MPWTEPIRQQPLTLAIEDIHQTRRKGGADMTPKLVETYYMKASDAASEYVEQEARKILRAHRRLREFIMGMGSWYFTDANGLIYDPPRYVTNSALAEFFKEWDEYLKLTGEPMRFTAYGPVVREW